MSIRIPSDNHYTIAPYQQKRRVYTYHENSYCLPSAITHIGCRRRALHDDKPPGRIRLARRRVATQSRRDALPDVDDGSAEAKAERPLAAGVDMSMRTAGGSARSSVPVAMERGQHQHMLYFRSGTRRWGREKGGRGGRGREARDTY